MMKQVIFTEKAPKAIGPYAQAVVAGGLVFTSGQLGIDVGTGKLADGVEQQAHAAMRNLAAILDAAGTGLGRAVKCTIFVQDLGDFAVVNQVYGSYFEEGFPARSCVQVAKLPLGGLVEIECVAELG